MAYNSQAQQIKSLLTMEDVAIHYGFEPGRSGFIRCPFHQGDRTASLKIYPGSGGFHCFGCGAHGSVIDFVMLLFNINFRQAILRLNMDFNLKLSDEKLDKNEVSKILQERAREAREREKCREVYINMCLIHRAMWTALKGGKTDTAMYEIALKELPQVDLWLEENERG